MLLAGDIYNAEIYRKVEYDTGPYSAHSSPGKCKYLLVMQLFYLYWKEVIFDNVTMSSF